MRRRIDEQQRELSDAVGSAGPEGPVFFGGNMTTMRQRKRRQSVPGLIRLRRSARWSRALHGMTAATE